MAKLFKNWTKQMKLVAWLESMGYVQIETKSSKYIAMKKGDSATFFLGKAGAFRGSRFGKASMSTPANYNIDEFQAFCSSQEVTK